jgi:hypothetical protein
VEAAQVTKPRKHLPIVHSDAVYEQNYAIRRAIVDERLAEIEAAVAACGPGAEQYGQHSVHDKLGIEPERVIYCCKRDGGDWQPPPPDLTDVRILRRSAVLVTRGGVKYQGSAVTIEKASRFIPDPVTHFLFRYDVATVALVDDYRPRTPEQMKAAAEKRRDKALAEQEAEAAAERAKAELQPLLPGFEQ